MMELTITSMTPADRLYTYNQSSQLEGQTGCIGHLRGDFGAGKEFYTSWFDHRREYKTDEFKTELDEVVNTLREKNGLLCTRDSMTRFCYRKYPEEITRLTERIAGYEQDVALAAAHPKAQEGFCGMEVDGKHYTEKEDAGKAIIDVCTRMTGSDAVLLGQYRGFSMVLAYDGRSNEYRITLKGTLSHTVTLGADVFGNITRLDNALENLAGSLQAEQNSLEETKTQLENARTELAAPFAREEELAEKTARLKELNILLNMDEKDKTLLDDTPDEGEDVPARRVAELAR